MICYIYLFYCYCIISSAVTFLQNRILVLETIAFVMVTVTVEPITTPTFISDGRTYTVPAMRDFRDGTVKVRADE